MPDDKGPECPDDIRKMEKQQWVTETMTAMINDVRLATEEDRNTALHEAAHAVAYSVFRHRPILSVTIVPTEEEIDGYQALGRVTIGGIRGMSYRNMMLFELICTLCAAFVVYIFRWRAFNIKPDKKQLERDASGSDLDWEQALEIVRPLLKSSSIIDWSVEDIPDQFIWGAIDSTRAPIIEFIDAHARQIATVAWELLKHKTITARTVHQVCKGTDTKYWRRRVKAAWSSHVVIERRIARRQGIGGILSTERDRRDQAKKATECKSAPISDSDIVPNIVQD